MSNHPQKLPTIPADDAAVAAVVGESQQLAILNYKTDKDTKVKRPSEAWVIPTLEMDAEFGSETVQAAFVKFVGNLQIDALRELADGDFDYLPVVGDLELLCKDYITDSRGERKGPKQTEINDWINLVLVPYLSARIKANLPNQTPEQQQNMLAVYSKKFRLAATRSNRLGNETLSDAALNDLQQRLGTYTGSDNPEKNIPKSEILDCMMARIASHRESIAKANAEVTAESF